VITPINDKIDMDQTGKNDLWPYDGSQQLRDKHAPSYNRKPEPGRLQQQEKQQKRPENKTVRSSGKHLQQSVHPAKTLNETQDAFTLTDKIKYLQ